MKNGGLILWNAIVICELSKTSWQMGKHLMSGDLRTILKARSVRLAQWLSIILFMRKTRQGSTNLVRMFNLVYSLQMQCVREESGKETLRIWKIWTRRKCVLVDSMQRRPEHRKMMNISYCQSQTEQWKRSGFPTIHLNTGLHRTRRRAQRWSSTRIGRVSAERHDDGWRSSPKSNDSFWSNGWILSDFCTRPFQTSPIWKESSTWNIPWICVNLGRNVERRYFYGRHWRIGEDSRIENLPSKNQRKRSINATKMETILFSQLQKAQQNCWEVMINSENPLQDRNNL